MFSKIVFFLAIVVAAVLLFATTRPDTILVERSIVIHAPRATHAPSSGTPRISAVAHSANGGIAR